MLSRHESCYADYLEPMYELCEICGKDDLSCECEECPKCNTIGSQDCYGGYCSGISDKKYYQYSGKPTNPSELWELWMGDKLSIGDAQRQLERSLFKYTRCGCCIGFYHDHLSVNGYVEGWDGELPTIDLEWGRFTIKQFNQAVEVADQQGVDMWNDTHGCPDCGIGESEYGGLCVNPECKSCEGAGEVI